MRLLQMQHVRADLRFVELGGIAFDPRRQFPDIAEILRLSGRRETPQFEQLDKASDRIMIQLGGRDGRPLGRGFMVRHTSILPPLPRSPTLLLMRHIRITAPAPLRRAAASFNKALEPTTPAVIIRVLHGSRQLPPWLLWESYSQALSAKGC